MAHSINYFLTIEAISLYSMFLKSCNKNAEGPRLILNLKLNNIALNYYFL